MDTVDPAVRALCGPIFSVMWSDDNWRLFGFKQRPRRGRIFNAFISYHKLRTEQFIYRELFLLAFIDVVEAVNERGLSPKDRAELMGNIELELFNTLGKTYIFTSLEEFIPYIKGGLDEYQKAVPYTAFSQRLVTFLGKNKIGNVVVGGAQLFSRFTPEEEKGFVLKRKVLRDFEPKKITSTSSINPTAAVVNYWNNIFNAL